MKIVLKLMLPIFGFISIFYGQDYSDIKKNTRIAIYSIEDKSSISGDYEFTGSLDEVIREMMITELVQSGNFTLIDRQQIEALMKEQGFQQSGLVTEQTAIELGNMLGVQLGIFGVINQFELKAVKKEGLESLLVRAVTDNQYKSEFTESTALVGLEVKIIDIKTGEIILADKAKTKQSIRRYENDGFTKEVIAKSARKAVQIIIEKIEDAAKVVPWEARITNVLDGSKVVINSGSTSDIQKGMIFSVFNVGEEIIDPTTGISLGSIETYSGKIRVIDNALGAGKASLCEIFDEKNTFSVNDIIKIPTDIPMSIYAFKHKEKGYYLFTADKDQSKNWEFKGVAFKAMTKQFEGTVPIFILQRKKGKYYKLSTNETNNEKWKSKGVAFYAYPNQLEGAIPVYQFRHEKNKHYYYTKGPDPSSKWGSKTISFYVSP